MEIQNHTYYRDGKTAYMMQVIDYFANTSPGRKNILDIPSGSGVFARELEKLGHSVVKGDIHGEDDSVYTDMESNLPFSTNTFNAVTCLEGIEHVLDPVSLIRELVRITVPGGLIIISTPNIANLHSRLQFLFTGTFFQFDARGVRQTRGKSVDRGHVSPFTPLQLLYVLGALGCALEEIRTDRWKRKILFPIYLLSKPISFFWARKIVRNVGPSTYPGVTNIYRFLTNLDLMFGRSQILFFRKL